MPEAFATCSIESSTPEPAPDGSTARPLLRLAGGSLAHFTMPPGEVSAAVSHRRVEELWYVLSGCGELWRRHAEADSLVPLRAGVAATIPPGACFQFRCLGAEPLVFIAVTMPPWSGVDEALPCAGFWPLLGGSSA
jgi:mannose-6-phosphate isomerase-like protein (cupin superfamily)